MDNPHADYDTPQSTAHLEGGWFSTNDLKLAVSLHAAGFPFRPESEVTRIMHNGRETFTWHFCGTNKSGDQIVDFLKQWDKEAPEHLTRPDAITCFFLARENMFCRTHIIAESHKAPQHMLLERGDKRLLVTSGLSRADRQSVAALAS